MRAQGHSETHTDPRPGQETPPRKQDRASPHVSPQLTRQGQLPSSFSSSAGFFLGHPCSPQRPEDGPGDGLQPTRTPLPGQKSKGLTGRGRPHLGHSDGATDLPAGGRPPTPAPSPLQKGPWITRERWEQVPLPPHGGGRAESSSRRNGRRADAHSGQPAVRARGTATG